MSKRRNFRDPTVERAQLSNIGDVLKGISNPQERNLFLLLTVSGLSLAESARRIGVPLEEARYLLARAVGRIRHPAYEGRIADEASDDSFVLRSAELRKWVQEAQMSLSVLCPRCSRRFLPDSLFDVLGGRPRVYCSNACRQAAYRARRRRSSQTATPPSS